MDFRRRVEDLLQQRPVGPEHRLDEVRADVRDALGRVTRVLHEFARYLHEPRILPSGSDPAEGAYYVSSVRIPRQEQLSWLYPIQLFYVLFPLQSSFVLGNSTVGQLVRVAAIGRGALDLSARRFFSAWHSVGLGGVVVYEGEVQSDSLQQSVEADIVRFLESMQEMMDAYRFRNAPERVLLWPIDLGYRPLICSVCLVPSGCGPLCAHCRSWRLHAQA